MIVEGDTCLPGAPGRRSGQMLFGSAEVPRQTVSAVETGQRTMSWTVFLALFLLFLNNKDTKQLMIALGIYTKEISKFINF
jgi:hypothetical protein